MLYISDQAFPLEINKFLAYLSVDEGGWQVTWGLEFHGTEREIDGVNWKPTVASHALEVTLPSLSELPGHEVKLMKSKEGEPQFLVYVFEHEPLLNTQLKFGSWDQGKIDFLLTGTADVLADEKYGAGLSIRVECQLPFAGVLVDEGSMAKAEKRLAQFFERSQFSTPERHENGGVLFRPLARDA